VDRDYHAQIGDSLADPVETPLDTTRCVGDRTGEAAALQGRARVEWRLGRYEHAVSSFHRALAIHRELADRRGEGSALPGLGIVYRRLAATSRRWRTTSGRWPSTTASVTALA
jgi:hypothetical protein